MFKINRQQQGEGAVKKSIQKLFDHKKDVGTRLKHLKNVIGNSSPSEVQSLFEKHYSHIYYIFYENFLVAEANLRLRGSHRAQREELDSILAVFQQILINLPDLIHKRWQYHSIDTIIKKLLHTQNSIKVRREGLNFFLLWLRALRENALPRTILVYACLVPGFPPPLCNDRKPCSLEWLVNTPINEDYGAHPVEITSLVPPSSGEKQPNDITKYFLDALLESMVLKCQTLNWKEKDKSSFQSFSFLWDLFKEHYLPHAFEDFSYSTSIYDCKLVLPEPRPPISYVVNASDSGSLDARIDVMSSSCPMLATKVSIIKWIVIFTGSFDKKDTLINKPNSAVQAIQRQVLKQLLEFTSSQNDKESDILDGRSTITSTSAGGTLTANNQLPDTETTNSNTSTLTEKEPSVSSLSSLDDKLQASTSAEEDIVRRVLYSTRQNINIVHELFRQAFMLPLTEVTTMRRVVKVYQQWIQEDEVPVFMKCPLSDESLVRAGPESTYQLFVTNSAHVFLVHPPPNAPKLVNLQVDVCKRVLNLYRHMVMNINLSDHTWSQVLRVLLHITRIMLQKAPYPDEEIGKYFTVSGKLASPVFQTLIVAWIKANLYVHVSKELWNELVDVLSSLCHWEELITEWSKNMETMTRVLSRNVYQIDLLDLPLDRLTEQKHKKRKAGLKGHRSGAPLLSERSFSRGWSQDSIPANDNPPSYSVSCASRSTSISYVNAADEKVESEDKLQPSNLHLPESLRPRSLTAPNSSSATGNSVNSNRDFPEERSTERPTTSDSNGSTLKRHLSSSDLASYDDGNRPPTLRQQSDSNNPRVELSQDLEMEATVNSNGHRVAWHHPTHQIHNYSCNSGGEASESTSLSVQSIDDYDEFDVLVNERLHSNSQDRDKRSEESWPNEATSLHSPDSVSIDTDWNRCVEPGVDRKIEDSQNHGTSTPQPSVHLSHIVDKDGSTFSAILEQSAESPGSYVSSPPYQLYANDATIKDSSAVLLLNESLDASGEPEDTQSREGMNVTDNILRVDSGDVTSIENARSFSPNDIESITAAVPGRPDSDASNILVTSCDTTLFHQSNTSNIKIIMEDVNEVNGFREIPEAEELDPNINTRSIMSGGTQTGWCPDVAAALWRRLLGILGDINEIENPHIHKLVFQYLFELWKTLYKMRQNIGIVTDDATVPDNQELIPPLQFVSSWAFKAVLNIPDSHKQGRLHAFQLLCNSTIQREHDIPLPEEHLALFYSILHINLRSTDQDVVNKIVESCSFYFPFCLPASTMLLLDFLYACQAVTISSDTQKVPRVQAQTILGSTLCFPNIYQGLPVLDPEKVEPTIFECNNLKDYIVEALLPSSKKEPSAAARCVALSSTGLWLYEELSSSQQRHSRIKEAINVLLVSVKFNNRMVASVACSQLHLLTHCSGELLSYMPDMPPRIIEVTSLTLSSLLNNNDAKNTEAGQQLIVSLLLCILDWCMAVPVDLLTDTYANHSEKKLIRTVFKALQTAALGKPGHSAKHSYSLSDLASKDFDPDLVLEKVQENSASHGRIKPSRSSTGPLDPTNSVSLAAHAVLDHLVNHLGHFPLARGTSVLSSIISEHHDMEQDTSDSLNELSPSLFNSPALQFFIYNDTCLISALELPCEAKDSSGARNFSSANRTVRFIIRDAGGKYCWESTVLHGGLDISELTTPATCQPPPLLDDGIGKATRQACDAYLQYANNEASTKRIIDEVPLPRYDKPLCEKSSDKLEQVLQHIGYSSSECQLSLGSPLNIPSSPPSCLTTNLQEKSTICLLEHHQSVGKNYDINSKKANWKSSAAIPSPTHSPRQSFYYARLFCTQLGFLSRHNRHRVHILQKNERLLLELKNLDSRNCRETHKIAVFYIAEGQEDKSSILANTRGSKAFEEFVAGLGWEVDLRTHCGFRGKLHGDGTNGTTAPYYATSTIEVIYHVATRFPSDANNIKIRHLGNDEVHIVWSEHHRDYRRGIIPTEFGDVLIVIYPIRHGLYRIQIIKKPEIPYFGPLFDGAVVNPRVLPVLVRETAINAGRAKRSLIKLYQPFYEERTRYLQQIVRKFKDDQSFEEYCSDLFIPAPEAQNASKAPKTDIRRVVPKHTSSSNAHSNANNNNTSTSVTRLSAHKKAFAPQPPNKSGSTRLIVNTSVDRTVPNVSLRKLDTSNQTAQCNFQETYYVAKSSTSAPFASNHADTFAAGSYKSHRPSSRNHIRSSLRGSFQPPVTVLQENLTNVPGFSTQTNSPTIDFSQVSSR